MLKFFNENITIEERYGNVPNSIDVIRLFLSLIVVYGHTFAVLFGSAGIGPNGETEIFSVISKGQLGSGTLAVYIFFIISGFLITQSMINSKSQVEYLIKRTLRLIPALVFCLFLSAFIIGPIVSKLNFGDYLNSELSPFKYFVNNSTFGIIGFYYNIADVFSTNPFPSSINASMWTLPNELACYFLVMIFSAFSFFENKRVMLLVCVISLVLVYWNIRYGFVPIPSKNDHWWMLGSNYIANFIKLSYFFITGSLMYCYKDKIKFSKSIFALLAIVLVVTARTGHLDYSLLVCLPYVTIFICLLKPIINLRKIGDFSYGIYIYAFPIQQLFAYYLSERLAFLPFFAITTFSIVLISVFSWYFIEKPALSLKKKFHKLISEKNRITLTSGK